MIISPDVIAKKPYLSEHRRLHGVCGVYTITNITNGKVYVGSSVDVGGRWKSHRATLRARKHKNPHLQAAWLKYGENAFRFSFLVTASEQDLRRVEGEICSALHANDPQRGYNFVEMDALSGVRRLSAETRAKIGAGQEGRSKSRGQIERMSRAMLEHYARQRLETTGSRWKFPRKVLRPLSVRLNLFDAPETSALGLPFDTVSRSQPVRVNLLPRQPKRKRIISIEGRKRLSEARKGRPHSEAHKAAMRVAFTNRGGFSAETKAKISAANTGQRRTEEQKKRMSEAYWNSRKARGLL